MSDLVHASDIERIVGTQRHRQAHYGRAASAEETVYVLHSQRCKDSGIDLRDCRFSRALDQGIRPTDWEGLEDIPVALAVWQGRLVPMRGTEKP